MAQLCWKGSPLTLNSHICSSPGELAKAPPVPCMECGAKDFAPGQEKTITK
jgi:hypothetical protein